MTHPWDDLSTKQRSFFSATDDTIITVALESARTAVQHYEQDYPGDPTARKLLETILHVVLNPADLHRTQRESLKELNPPGHSTFEPQIALIQSILADTRRTVIYWASYKDGHRSSRDTAALSSAHALEQALSIGKPLTRRQDGRYTANVPATQQHQLFTHIAGPEEDHRFDPSWRTSDTTALAKEIVQTRNLDLLPILADALQDAGFDHEEVLFQLRHEHQLSTPAHWVIRQLQASNHATQRTLVIPTHIPQSHPEHQPSDSNTVCNGASPKGRSPHRPETPPSPLVNEVVQATAETTTTKKGTPEAVPLLRRLRSLSNTLRTRTVESNLGAHDPTRQALETVLHSVGSAIGHLSRDWYLTHANASEAAYHSAYRRSPLSGYGPYLDHEQVLHTHLTGPDDQSFDPSLRTTDAVNLAREIVQTRNTDLLPILADALQDAGYSDETILSQLRHEHQLSTPAHWVIRQLLGDTP